MKVEWQRQTNGGRRSILVVASDTTDNPATIREWINMLQTAEKWLRQKPKEDQSDAEA